MPKFTVTETQRVIRTAIWTVDADSIEEAHMSETPDDVVWQNDIRESNTEVEPEDA